MRVNAYLRVVNFESAIRALEELKIPGAGIKQLQSRTDDGTDFWWMWQSSTVDLDEEKLDSGVKALLETHRGFFSRMKQIAGPEADISLQIVTRYNPSDRPLGLSLSSETVSLLGQLGAGIDNDVIRDLARSS